MSTIKATTPITILLVDDHQVVRRGFKMMLEGAPEIRVVGEESAVQNVLIKVRELQPDIVLMDIKLGSVGANGIDITRELKSRFPNVNVIIISNFDEDEYVKEAVRAGASGYLLKDIGQEDLIQAIRTVYKGGAAVNPILNKKILKEFAAMTPNITYHPSSEGPLSDKEMQVLAILTEGYSNKDIAAKMFITEKTVKAHVSSILRKLGVKDRTQAVIFALKRGLVK